VLFAEKNKKKNKKESDKKIIISKND